MVALPIELDKERWISLLTDLIQEKFVENGMCADESVSDVLDEEDEIQPVRGDLRQGTRGKLRFSRRKYRDKGQER